MWRREGVRKGMEEASAAEGEPRRAAGPLPRQALLPASVGSPAWRRQRSSRAADLSKEMWWFLGTAGTAGFLTEKTRGRKMEMHDGF